jgi:predicted transcriptional regulator
VKSEPNTSPEYGIIKDSLEEVLLWQRDQIEQSLRLADAGSLIPHCEVKKAVRNWVLVRSGATDTSP